MSDVTIDKNKAILEVLDKIEKIKNNFLNDLNNLRLERDKQIQSITDQEALKKVRESISIE